MPNEHIPGNKESFKEVVQQPHSRACGFEEHSHGPACHHNCPTCAGGSENWPVNQPPHIAALKDNQFGTSKYHGVITPDGETIVRMGYNPVEAIKALCGAIVLTVDYVGNEVLPAVEGWPWYDVLKQYDLKAAQDFVDSPVMTGRVREILVSEDEPEEQSQLVSYAARELKAAGLFDSDGDYGGKLGPDILDIIEMFSKQGHSGFSAAMTADIVGKLMRYQPLTPITNNPDDWMKIDPDMWPNDDGIWQCRRNPEAFSNDGGKTYYILSEGANDSNRNPVHLAAEYQPTGG
jgi:hypothetical protein